VSAQWGYDTNPFYSPDSSEATGEGSSRYSLGLGAVLPFRTSELDLGYRRNRLHYEKTTLNEDTIDEFEGGVGLRSFAGDVIDLRTSLTRGVADTIRFDPGGEAVFRGEPYDYREVSASAQRETPGRSGYLFRAARRDLVFTGDGEAINYFEYRGWDLRGEYRHPLGRTSWGTAAYEGRRFDHFCRTLDPAGTACPGTGIPFREERADAVYLGARGQFAPRSSYSVRLGWLDLGYSGTIDQGYSGPVGDASARFALSYGMWIEATLIRQAYSSFYRNNNFFVYSAGQVGYGIEWGGRWEMVARALYSRTSYDVPDPDGILREDDTLRMEAYANLFLPRRFGIRFTVADDRRDSTIAGRGFDRRTFLVGAFFGWL